MILQYVFFVSALCLSVPMFTDNPRYLMPSFCVYEIMIGIFWPGIGTLRSEYLPEKHRHGRQGGTGSPSVGQPTVSPCTSTAGVQVGV